MEGAFYGISAKGKFRKKSMRDVAAEAGVSQETSRRWIVQYEADGSGESLCMMGQFHTG